jgi:Flp pilus assembly protein protease CpaA
MFWIVSSVILGVILIIVLYVNSKQSDMIEKLLTQQERLLSKYIDLKVDLMVENNKEDIK